MTGYTEEELIEILIETVAALGWQVAIPDLDDDEDVPGMIIGKQQYINDVIAGKYTDDDES